MKYRVFIKDESGTIQGTSYPCESAREAVAVTFREVRAGNSNAEPQYSETGEDGTWLKMTINREPPVAGR